MGNFYNLKVLCCLKVRITLPSAKGGREEAIFNKEPRSSTNVWINRVLNLNIYDPKVQCSQHLTGILTTRYCTRHAPFKWEGGEHSNGPGVCCTCRGPRFSFRHWWRLAISVTPAPLWGLQYPPCSALYRLLHASTTHEFVLSLLLSISFPAFLPPSPLYTHKHTYNEGWYFCYMKNYRSSMYLKTYFRTM